MRDSDWDLGHYINLIRALVCLENAHCIVQLIKGWKQTATMSKRSDTLSSNMVVSDQLCTIQVRFRSHIQRLHRGIEVMQGVC